MDKLFEDLKTVLTDELTLHSELVNAAEKMNHAIKEKNVEAVHSMTGIYDSIIGQIDTLEAKRLEICDGIAQKGNPPKKHMTLQSALTLLSKKEQEPFFDLRKALKDKVNSLSRINTANELMLNETLLAVSKKFELITHFEVKKGSYKNTGTMDTATVRRNIVNQIV